MSFIDKAPDRSRARTFLNKDGERMMVYVEDVNNYEGWAGGPAKAEPEKEDKETRKTGEKEPETEEALVMDFDKMESPALKVYAKKHFPELKFYPNAKKATMLQLIKDEVAKLPPIEFMSNKNDNTAKDN